MRKIIILCNISQDFKRFISKKASLTRATELPINRLDEPSCAESKDGAISVCGAEQGII
jgi:hypothetical protein